MTKFLHDYIFVCYFWDDNSENSSNKYLFSAYYLLMWARCWRCNIEQIKHNSCPLGAYIHYYCGPGAAWVSNTLYQLRFIAKSNRKWLIKVWAEFINSGAWKQDSRWHSQKHCPNLCQRKWSSEVTLWSH